MNVATDELVSIRDFRRQSAEVIERLRKGEVEKQVLTRHGHPVAVVLSVEEYERLSDTES